MMPELTLPGDEPVLLHPSSLRKFKGIRLPGSEYWFAERDGLVIHFQEYIHSNFSLSYRITGSYDIASSISVKEDPGMLRLEAVLEGSLIINEENGEKRKIDAGQYRLIQDDYCKIYLPDNIHCKWIVAKIDANNIDQNTTSFRNGNNEAADLPGAMQTLLIELLHNRYQPHLLPFYYENCVRELFFQHLIQQIIPEDDQIFPNELNAVYEAERIIRENLSTHFSIQDLARKTGTNEYKLKKDFRAVFNTGLFGRLMQLRMEHAGQLLEKTSLSIKDIAEQTGYDTVAGFITAFRKHYGLPPGEWRAKKRA